MIHEEFLEKQDYCRDKLGFFGLDKEIKIFNSSKKSEELVQFLTSGLTDSQFKCFILFLKRDPIVENDRLGVSLSSFVTMVFEVYDKIKILERGGVCEFSKGN